VIHAFDEEQGRIDVIDIDHRSDVYR